MDSTESQNRPGPSRRLSKGRKAAQTGEPPAKPKAQREVVLRCMVKHPIIIARSEIGEDGEPVRDRNKGRVVKTLTLGATIDEGVKGKPQPMMRVPHDEWLKFRRDPAAGPAIKGLKKTGALLVLNG